MNQLTRDFWRFGLIGYPLGHSFSPVLHHTALAAAGMRGEYRLYPIEPSEQGETEIHLLVEKIRSGEIHGLNVTIPHKQTVIKYMHQLSNTAQAVGAVNTIFLDKDGMVNGDNTDVPGFLQDLKKIVQGKPGKALVLGAGGSARAVVYGLYQAGWEILVLARRVDQARSLIAEVCRSEEQKEPVRAGNLDMQGFSAGDDCDLLVNTTPVGMHPNPDVCPWPDMLPLPERAAVYDLIYNPLATCLLKRARRAGLASANGAGMLSAQAALAFAKWTGLQPPFAVMEQAFPNRSPIH